MRKPSNRPKLNSQAKPEGIMDYGLRVPGNTEMDPLLRTRVTCIGGPEIHDLDMPGFSQIPSPGSLDFRKSKPPEAWIS